ncbi:putative redox protein [Clostridium acetobutylicum]|uniref:Stress-induced protein OsmC n=1 Tax=Clostridium acetobutylicum (strain ATCC 824 / DSM 792 / JCM 1419 / IAM 19013 / LMG 5710 / NBRC 13948 / NRRL B-527 / VKM B-1787 / 2291 / W) TaxID=272562 RepID=Q97GX0_CLOAB|nr:MULTISPECIES: OsmC family protein [Clostridium]AAK80202.1 Stress-induced protein OsmC [Clostridium acetobutylicum ATCC 824]ADZ21296.1 Stress-induced protein OsmC [Clostridium acetobutylicum EA 2018]AEI32245.1 stress-induced protein OsmC [Clostridium acetobutylicum DSM 1731]AWV79373.1 OsmC family peroxiredoxin [Clostridium acetobutylicum]MBC2394656.1 OsmC family protein [Clostridium acetobutylicum]
MIISESEKENYYTKIFSSNAVIFSDVTKEKGGNGESFGPHDLLCASLASCLNITIRMILEHKNIKYDNVIVKVDLDKSDDTKVKFLYNVDILGDISYEIKHRVIDIAKKCPVRRTLSKEIEFEIKENL